MISNQFLSRENEQEQIIGPPVLENSNTILMDTSESKQSNDLITRNDRVSYGSLIVKIGQLMSQLALTNQRLFLYEDLSNRLMRENQKLITQLRQMSGKIDQCCSLIKKRQQYIQEVDKQKSELQIKIQKLQSNVKLIKNGQVNSKQKRMNRQLIKINFLLEKQLQLSNSKIIELQKLIQERTCSALQDNIQKIRRKSIKFQYYQPQEKSILNVIPINSIQSSVYRNRTRSTKNYVH